MSGLWMQLVGRESLIAPDDIWGLLTVVCVGVVTSIVLEQKYAWASKVSGAIVALIIAMTLGNLGIVPTSSVLYDDVIWNLAVPMSLPMLLIQCDLKRVWRETGRMLSIFLIGAVGTMVGGLVTYVLMKGIYGEPSDVAKAVTALTGTYIGGGVNFMSLATQYKASDDMTAALFVADSLLMALSMIVLLMCAKSTWFRRRFSHPLIDEVESRDDETGGSSAGFWKRRDISIKDIAANFGYSVLVVWMSNVTAEVFAGLGDGVIAFIGSQEYLWITTYSVFFATVFGKRIGSIHGSQELGMYMIYLFLFVVGVPANVATVIKQGPLLMVMAALVVIFNMLFSFGAAYVMKYDLEEAIIASNANIGATSTAVGMAISQGWTALLGPGMLAGILGYVLGNYGGMAVAGILGL